jgi:hypothetical protein
MLNDFKNTFFGGTRSNRFRIDGSFPTGGRFTDFHIRSATLPRVTSKTLSYDYFGRKFHYPGERDYGTWNITIWDDVGNNNLWGKLNKWQNLINDHDKNQSSILPKRYKSDNWRVQHLDLNGNDQPLKEYILHGCWPAGIQPVQMNMGSPNVLNSYTVMIVFDYMEIKNITRRT